ncbi:MAG: hypothetical protein ABSD68_03050 [Candidatus Micrarchaeales archaeon]|jgi:hypothetical protein
MRLNIFKKEVKPEVKIEMPTFETMLRDNATKHLDWRVRLSAVNQLKDEELLRNIAKTDRAPCIKEAAEERLKELQKQSPAAQI